MDSKNEPNIDKMAAILSLQTGAGNAAKEAMDIKEENSAKLNQELPSTYDLDQEDEEDEAAPPPA